MRRERSMACEVEASSLGNEKVGRGGLRNGRRMEREQEATRAEVERRRARETAREGRRFLTLWQAGATSTSRG